MNSFYSLIIFVCSPLLALVADSIFKKKPSKVSIVILVLFCLLFTSPLLFTNYSYGGFYSYLLVIGITASIILFLIFKHWEAPKFGKLFVSTFLVLIFVPPIVLLVVMSGFGGREEIYKVKEVNRYKLIYKREADVVLAGHTKVELYKTALFGLLQKQIDSKYVDQGKSPCQITLTDNSTGKVFAYNPCENTIK